MARGQGLGLEDHAAPAPEGRVVGDPVPPARVVAEIEHADVHQPARPRAAEDRLAERRLEHPREQGHDVDPHRSAALPADRHDPALRHAHLHHELRHRGQEPSAGSRSITQSGCAPGSTRTNRPSAARPASPPRRPRAATDRTALAGAAPARAHREQPARERRAASGESTPSSRRRRCRLEAAGDDAARLLPVRRRLPQQARLERLEPLPRPVGERTHPHLPTDPVGPSTSPTATSGAPVTAIL